MTEDIFAKKLEWFKENEKPEVVLCIADDSGLIKIIIAWTNTTVMQNKSWFSSEKVGSFSRFCVAKPWSLTL